MRALSQAPGWPECSTASFARLPRVNAFANSTVQQIPSRRETRVGVPLAECSTVEHQIPSWRKTVAVQVATLSPMFEQADKEQRRMAISST